MQFLSGLLTAVVGAILNWVASILSREYFKQRTRDEIRSDAENRSKITIQKIKDADTESERINATKDIAGDAF
jgi:ABC-type bacteriocin/lantibiotic exporter with double-glycine peptidase domain